MTSKLVSSWGPGIPVFMGTFCQHRIYINEANKHITIHSEGSCDTVDWSNDADSSALHHRI